MINPDYFKREVSADISMVLKIRAQSKLCYQQLIEGILYSEKCIYQDCNGKIVWSDTARSLYAIVNDKFFIVPAKSKVSNWGFDGSGVNMKSEIKNVEDLWPLDLDESFHIQLMNDVTKEKENNCILNDERLKIGILNLMECDLKYLLFRILGSDYNRTRMIQKQMSLLLKRTDIVV